MSTTDVVPSPTSLSCFCERSTNTRPAGCSTARRERIVAPSFEIVTSCIAKCGLSKRCLFVRSMTTHSNVIHQHLVQTHGSKGAFHNVRNCLCGQDCVVSTFVNAARTGGDGRTILIAHILPRYTVAAQECTRTRIALEHIEDVSGGRDGTGREVWTIALERFLSNTRREYLRIRQLSCGVYDPPSRLLNFKLT